MLRAACELSVLNFLQFGLLILVDTLCTVDTFLMMQSSSSLIVDSSQLPELFSPTR